MFLKQSNSRRSFRLSLGGSQLSGCLCLLAGVAGVVAVTSIDRVAFKEISAERVDAVRHRLCERGDPVHSERVDDGVGLARRDALTA